MPRKGTATLGVAILVSTCFESLQSRRVQTQTELWNRATEVHPEGAELRRDYVETPTEVLNHTPPDQQASSFISRSQVDSASVQRKSSQALQSDGETSHASEPLHRSVGTSSQSDSVWKWLSSGGPFPSLALAMSTLALGDGEAASLHDPSRYIQYCGLSLFLVVFCACSCCLMEWFKSFPWKRRHQYVHRGRMIYEWVQTPKTITFFTMLPPGLTQESLEVKVWPRHAKIGRSGKVPFITEGLYDSVDVDRCTWDVSWRGELTVTLAKDFEKQWPCVFTAHHPDKSVREREKGSTRSHRSEKNSSKK